MRASFLLALRGPRDLVTHVTCHSPLLNPSDAGGLGLPVASPRPLYVQGANSAAQASSSAQRGGKARLYAAIGAVVIVIVILAALYAGGLLRPQASVHYLGSPSGYEAFVPNGQTVNYNGQTDPVGNLILNNGTTLHDVIWNGQYASTIINNHNQIVQLNSQFVGQTDPVNHQPYVPLQDFYVIKGQVPIEQAIINGQTYYVIEANKINPANIAGFYTYDKWVPNFVAAINTPGTNAAVIPGNSPVYDWANVTGTLVYETHLYQQYSSIDIAGGYVLVLPNKTITPLEQLEILLVHLLAIFMSQTKYITLLTNFLIIF